jgi:regulator of nucleoside diphosphate kinase
VKSRSKSRSSKSVTVTTADFANLSLLEPYAPLQRLLETAKVAASDEMPHDVVTMNTQVVLHDETSGERRAVRIVFPDDADPAKDQISVLEPLGVQLLGKSPADVLDCELADGVHRLKVEQVIYQPEHSLRTNLVVRPLTRSGK